MQPGLLSEDLGWIAVLWGELLGGSLGCVVVVMWCEEVKWCFADLVIVEIFHSWAYAHIVLGLTTHQLSMYHVVNILMWHL